jgi:hypothetical protein
MLNKLFSKNKIKPSLVFSQKGNIWRIHFSGDILACETRNLSSRQVYFFSLNYKSNELFLKDYQVEEKWWVSIESVNGDTLYLNYFKTPELPEHLGITAIDVKTGNIKWTNTDLAFWFATDRDVYAVKELFEGKVYYRLDMGTGEIAKEYNDSDAENSLSQIQNMYESAHYSKFQNARIYVPDDESEEIDVRSHFKEKFRDIKYLGSVEYIKHNSYLVYNYHADKGINLKEINERYLSNILEIYNFDNDRHSYYDVINKEAANYVPDSFFVNDGYLFFVKERKEMVIINLDERSS